MAWDGCVGHFCEQSAQNEVRCQSVYILCAGLSTGDLQLAAGRLSGHLEYGDVLKLMVRKKRDNWIKERLTAMALLETNVRWNNETTKVCVAAFLQGAAINEIYENVFIYIIRNGVSLMAVIKILCPAVTHNEVIPTTSGMCLMNDRNQTRIMLHFRITYPGFFFHFGFTGTSFPIMIDSRTLRAANIKKSKKTSESIY